MPVTLLYHDIAEPESREAVGFPGALAARYKLSPADFERHLDAIAEVQRKVGLITLSRPWPDVILTFDDGGASACNVATRLERRGWRGHFFVTTGRLGTPGFVTAEQVRDLAARGHAIGSHTHSHPDYFRTLPRSVLDREWRESHRVLTEILGQPPDTAAVPGGSSSEDVLTSAAEAGYRLVMTSEPIAKVRIQGAATVLGRYTIWGSTRPSQVSGYVRGSYLVRSRLWVEWNLKKVAKRISPSIYQRLRHVRARSGRA